MTHRTRSCLALDRVLFFHTTPMAPPLTETYLGLLQLLRDARLVFDAHANAILYLIPVLLICAWLQALHARSGLYTKSLSLLAGVFIHELLHLLVGVLTYAKPVAMSIIPRHIDKGYYELGHVRLNNIRWFNAVFVGFAPLLGFVGVAIFIHWRTRYGWFFSWWDLLAWYVLAQVSMSAWPSTSDIKIALRSWPLLIPIAGYFAL